MSKNEEHLSIDARIIIGEVIVKHKIKFSGEETILQIQVNPYLQYFLGLRENREQLPIEEKLGQVKNGYDLGYLRARTSSTSDS